MLFLPSLTPSLPQVEGLNEEVLKRLLQLYLLKTGNRDGTDLQPYLDPERSLGTIGSCLGVHRVVVFASLMPDTAE